MKEKLYSNKNLLYLFIPLVIEQGLEYLVGFADSLMVAKVGEAAVSGVSLVDFVMALLISIFTALATGGGAITGQYLGSKKDNEANQSALQMMKVTFYLSIVITLIIFVFKNSILHLLFGSISSDVYPSCDDIFKCCCIINTISSHLQWWSSNISNNEQFKTTNANHVSDEYC